MTMASEQYKSPYRLCFAIITALIFYFKLEEFLRGELWAEDGSQIFPAALCGTAFNIVRPLDGGYFVLERFLALIAAKLTTMYTPHYYYICATIIYIICCSWFARPSFRQLVQSDLLRIGTCILIAIAPGAYETVGNFACAPYTIALLMTLLVFEERERLTYPFIFLWTLLALSSHIALAILPVILILTRERRKMFRIPFCILGGIGALQLATMVLSEATRKYAYSPDYVTLLSDSILNVGINLVGLPLLGIAGYTKAFATLDIFFICILCAIALCLMGIILNRTASSSEHFHMFLGLALISCTFLIIHSLARGALYKEIPLLGAYTRFVNRHTWLVYTMGLISMVLFAANTRFYKTHSLLGTFLILVVLSYPPIVDFKWFLLSKPLPQNSWAPFAQELMIARASTTTTTVNHTLLLGPVYKGVAWGELRMSASHKQCTETIKRNTVTFNAE